MKPTILVVDDEAPSRNALKFALEVDGYRVETCSSAEGAISALTSHSKDHYHVVITDMIMERDDSGLDVVRATRQNAPFTPVIVLTGFSAMEDSVSSMQVGAFSYLPKGDGDSADLLLMHLERAIHYRTGLRLASDEFFDAMEHAVDGLSETVSRLNVLTAELKSLADARIRLLKEAGVRT